MSLEKTLHIKIDDTLDRHLRRLAGERSQSVGEIVRHAIRTAYRLGLEGLSARHQAALGAYEAGYISLGKLAEELGMDALSLRKWLAENGFDVHEDFAVSDAERA